MDIADKLKTLEETEDPAIRHSLALELADTHDPRVLPILIGLIGRPDLCNRRGTLVYCLGEYNCRPYVELLVQLVIEGNFEVAMTADTLLADLGDIDGDDVLRCYEALTAAACSVDVDDWRRAAIGNLLDRFE